MNCGTTPTLVRGLQLFKNNFNSRFAANLLANWLAGLAQVVYGKSVDIPEVQQQADNQLLMYFGHDVQVHLG